MVLPAVAAGARIAGGAIAKGSQGAGRGIVNARKTSSGTGSVGPNGRRVSNPEMYRRAIRTAEQRFKGEESIPARVGKKVDRDASSENLPEEIAIPQLQQQATPSLKTRVRQGLRATSKTKTKPGIGNVGTSFRVGGSISIIGFCLLWGIPCLILGFGLMGLGNKSVLWGLTTYDTFAPLSAAGLLFTFIGATLFLGASIAIWFLYRDLKKLRRVFSRR